MQFYGEAEMSAVFGVQGQGLEMRIICLSLFWEREEIGYSALSPSVLISHGDYRGHSWFMPA